MSTVAKAMAEHPQVIEVRFWLFNEHLYRAFEQALRELHTMS